jgi:hypothetical protein
MNLFRLSFRAHRVDGVCAAALLLSVPLLICAAAQQPSPSQPDAPPPAVFENLIPAWQFAFIGAYAGQPVKHLKKDKQFSALMKLAVPRTEYHYGSDMSLSDAIDIVLSGSMQPVSIIGGRYAFIPGTNGPYLHGRGFMWFDMQQGDAAGVFYFQPTNGEPSPTLTVFSRQLSGTDLGMSQLPEGFADALHQWSLAEQIPVVSSTYLIPQNGKKYVLVHDEDYCGQVPGAPAAASGVCEQLNADAANADMNSAYFMRETHNAANATAWMLGPDQIGWIGLRDRSCGLGLPCRITMTRERTGVLLGRPIGTRTH